ncbi:MAG: sulfur carrier protein ThiS [Gemmatimonadota bacterium]|nr:sulfur carrier protein ThiS [Gemmatimonadota bacterium]MDH3422321.1 sulfur carrier protein ThiS [Gemmatimonadota bacterium]
MKATETIRIRLNGKERDLEVGHTVTTLLESLELHPGMVVVELNRDILVRERYAEVPVSDGDSLELVHFVGGG